MISNFGLKNILGIIIGIAFIVSNILTFINRAELINNGLETSAIVTEFWRTGYRTSRKVYVDYTIDSITYHNRLNLRSNSTYIGEEVTIIYNPNNPNMITPRDRDNATDDTGSLVVYSVIGALYILLCVSLGRDNVKKAKRRMFI